MLTNGFSLDNLISGVIVVAVMLLVAFPFHEFAHALAAYRLGDSTARLFGRLSLDPRVHFDPMGGLMLIVSFLFIGFGFGWAKPTPVNPRNLRYGQWGEAIVAAAGPLSNLVLAIAGSIPLRYMVATGMDVPILEATLFYFVEINLILMVFNLFPIPPLDGSKVLFAFLPPRMVWQWRPILEQYGFVLLLLVFFLPPGGSIGGRIITPILNGLYTFLVGL